MTTPIRPTVRSRASRHLLPTTVGGMVHKTGLSQERRTRLRERALERWGKANTVVFEQIGRGSSGTTFAYGARSGVRRDHVLHAVDRVGRVLERELRDSAVGVSGHDGDGSRPGVLVADQRPVDRVLLLHAFRLDGRIRVVGDALDGAEALALSLLEQPDVLLIDDRLATMSGAAVVELLATYAPETRCILLIDCGEQSPPPIRAGTLRLRRDAVDRRILVDLTARLVGL